MHYFEDISNRYKYGVVLRGPPSLVEQCVRWYMSGGAWTDDEQIAFPKHLLRSNVVLDAIADEALRMVAILDYRTIVKFEEYYSNGLPFYLSAAYSVYRDRDIFVRAIYDTLANCDYQHLLRFANIVDRYKHVLTSTVVRLHYQNKWGA